MAELAKDGWSSQVLCRYYMHGVCKSGGDCPFSHDFGSSPAKVCRYYQQGTCSYGDKCRYDHIKSKPDSHKTKSSTPYHPSQIPPSYSTGSGSAMGWGPPRDQGSSSSASSSSSSSPYVIAPKPLNLPADMGRSPTTCKLVTLKKHGHTSSDSGLGDEVSSPAAKNPEHWVQAAEFVPGQLWKGSIPSSYLAAAQTGVEQLSVSDAPSEKTEEEQSVGTKAELCPYAAHGQCRFGEHCTYLHGDLCEYCGKATLHPTDDSLRQSHRQECMKRHEEDMELSFAIQRSQGKSCGICMDEVWEKQPPTEQRFGILSDCCHVFCLSCIRKWRAAKQFENKIVRACPECRTKSDFVTPSKYWVDDQAEKQKLIDGYKNALSSKACKYFDEGRGECPFNENCFYQHAYPDGRKASPKPQRRRRRQDAEGEFDVIGQIILWDFLEDRNVRALPVFDLDDMDFEYFYHLNFWESSDSESDASDFDLYH